MNDDMRQVITETVEEVLPVFAKSIVTRDDFNSFSEDIRTLLEANRQRLDMAVEALNATSILVTNTHNHLDKVLDMVSKLIEELRKVKSAQSSLEQEQAQIQERFTILERQVAILTN